MTDILKPLVIKGTLYWVERDKLNKFSDKYQIQLGNLSDVAVAAFEERGMVPTNKGGDDERGFFVTMKSNNPMRISDEAGDEIDADVLISNGSKAVCVIGHYDWSVGEGRSPSLIRCTVTDLVQYIPETYNEEDAL